MEMALHITISPAEGLFKFIAAFSLSRGNLPNTFPFPFPKQIIQAVFKEANRLVKISDEKREALNTISKR